MLNWLLACCISMTGDNDFVTRQRGEHLLQLVVGLTGYPGSVEQAARHHPDLEVRRRCRRVMARHYHVDVPPWLRMQHFREWQTDEPDLWRHANSYPCGDDVFVLVNLLLEKGMNPRKARRLVLLARLRCTREDLQWRFHRLIKSLRGPDTYQYPNPGCYPCES